MNKTITLFGASWCPYCVQLRKILDKEGIEYKHKSVDDKANEQEMLEASGGRYLIPTIVIGDGEKVMQNPTIAMVKEALA